MSLDANDVVAMLVAHPKRLLHVQRCQLLGDLEKLSEERNLQVYGVHCAIANFSSQEVF